ncbi:hypothetical protein [Corallococcus exercitus]|uniref:Uncharacterized protein n=1 Tax=Corallococcus exercitus TaxID=2316736 RepID=A0A7Y4JNR1_9BACT|nr:hypothetical protein [Corallococcus exercitus]NOK08401.1 hypothetical protein [Corallococcus exercitus]
MADNSKPPPPTLLTPHVSEASSSPLKAPCNPHRWGLKPPIQKHSVAQKIQRLRNQEDLGSLAEAAAAEHNNVTHGDDMSGANAASKMYQVCMVCGAMGGEIDHVNRNAAGLVAEIVEVKGGKCNVNKVQLLRQKEMADALGAKVRVKLQGVGAQRASEVIANAPELKDVLVTIL